MKIVYLDHHVIVDEPFDLSAEIDVQAGCRSVAFYRRGHGPYLGIRYLFLFECEGGVGNKWVVNGRNGFRIVCVCFTNMHAGPR